MGEMPNELQIRKDLKNERLMLERLLELAENEKVDELKKMLREELNRVNDTLDG
ncbi:MAG: hypothetical protein NC078_10825 [Ruminococcus sp.]|nr:hypothetical protein [Ruminococcus sp.]